MWARTGRWILPEMPDFHVAFRNLLHAVNLRHETDGFTSPPKEGVLKIFFRPEKSDGFGWVWTQELGVPKASKLPLDRRSRCLNSFFPIYSKSVKFRWQTKRFWSSAECSFSGFLYNSAGLYYARWSLDKWDAISNTFSVTAHHSGLKDCLTVISKVWSLGKSVFVCFTLSKLEQKDILSNVCNIPQKRSIRRSCLTVSLEFILVNGL